MRIIAGEWGGRPLSTPRGQTTRPTADRVREALFSILGDMSGARVLDLYAGTGAVALESLSRGAASALAVERAPAALAILKSNAERLGPGHRLQWRLMDALTYARSTRDRFDLVFADPPWALAESVAEALGGMGAGLLNPGGTLVLERGRKGSAPGEFGGLDGPDTRRYGDTILVIYRRSAGP